MKKFFVYQSPLDINKPLEGKEEVAEETFWEKVKNALNEIFERNYQAKKAFPSVQDHLLTRTGALSISDKAFEVIYE